MEIPVSILTALEAMLSAYAPLTRKRDERSRT